MTSNITIGDYTNVKPHAVNWKCSVSNFVDTCKIRLPLTTSIESNAAETIDGENFKQLKALFNEGDYVVVHLGYNDINTKRFCGFIDKISYSTPLEIECEGYSYLLKKKIFTKSYASTTILEILTDLIGDTGIVLSKYIPHVPLTSVTFKNTPGLKVLEWFQKECLCTVFFDFDTLYVGPSKYAVLKDTVDIRLGWNTIDEKDLKKITEQTVTEIHIVTKSNSGEVQKTKSENKKYDNVKEIKIRSGLSNDFKTTIQNELQAAEDYKGYEGSVLLFLEPVIEKSNAVYVDDAKYGERDGKFFCETVEGSFDKSGGRQKIYLRYYAN